MSILVEMIHYSFSHPILNLIIMLLLGGVYVYPIFNKRGLIYRQHADSRLNFWFFLVLVSLFCTFSFSNGDFYNYQGAFLRTVRYGKSGHMEFVYDWLINHITHSYLVWRLIVWSIATYFTILSFKRLGLSSIPAYASLTLFYVTTLYIMRGNLGVAIMLYGLTFLLNPPKGKIGGATVLGLLLILVSYCFHKSMILSVALLFLANLNFTRTRIRWSLYLFPVSVIAMRYFLDYMVDNGLGADDELSIYAKHYAGVQQFISNANGWIANFFCYGPVYYTIYYTYRHNLLEKFPKPIKFFYNYWYVWVYIASVCAFQDVGGWYFSRFMYMSNMPWAVFMAYLYANTPNSKQMKLLTLWAYIGAVYPVLYSVYKY